jgi:hypothetical protein
MWYELVFVNASVLNNGTWTFNQWWWYNVFFRYKIEDYPVERHYKINLNIKVCFNSTVECQIDMDIFTNAMIPKRQCQWDMDYSTSGNTRDLGGYGV